MKYSGKKYAQNKNERRTDPELTLRGGVVVSLGGPRGREAENAKGKQREVVCVLLLR